MKGDGRGRGPKRTFKQTNNCGGDTNVTTTLGQGVQLEAPEMIPC